LEEYLIENSIWIGTSTCNPLYSHEMWNQHEASQLMIPRSFNMTEGWHSMMCCSKPTKFLDCLKSEQALTDVKLTKRLLHEPSELP
jgi:hypothetical protein